MNNLKHKYFFERYKKISTFLSNNSLFLLFFIFFATFLIIRIKQYNQIEQGIYSDQSTHLMQSISLAYHHDLEYTKSDLDIFKLQGWSNYPAGLFLNKVDSKFIYAKPFLYSLVSAPFTFLLGAKGPLIINIFSLLGIFAVSFFYSKTNSEQKNLYVLIIILALILLSPYMMWVTVIHPDIFISLLLLTSYYYLYKSVQDKTTDVSRIIISSVLMGLVIFEKPPFIVFALTAYLFLILKRINISKLLIYFFSSILSFLLPSMVVLLQTGKLITYQADRWYYSLPPFVTDHGTSGFPVKTDLYFTGEYFLNTLFNGLSNFLLTFKYYVFGLNTGLALYFPALLIMIPFAIYSLQKRSKFLIAVITGLFLYVISYMIFLYFNYYGGSGSFGNRYFLQVYAITFLLFTPVIYKIKQVKMSLLLLLPAFIVYTIIWSLPYHSVSSRFSFIEYFPRYHLLPLERTMIHTIQGRSAETKSGQRIYMWNTYNNEEGIIWTRGDSRARLVIVSRENLVNKNISLNLNTALSQTTVEGSIEDLDFLETVTSQGKQLTLPLEKTVCYYVKGGKECTIELQVQTYGTFVPALLDSKSNDERLLGIGISDIVIE